MDNTVKQLKQFRTDALYGKKKHYNAAERKRKYSMLFSVLQIVINAITGSTLLVVVFGDDNKCAEVLALIFSITATIVAGVQKLGDFENQSLGNQKVANAYLRIGKTINLILKLYEDGAYNRKELSEQTQKILADISETNELATQFSTSYKDYERAKQGIKNGEEDYTSEDMKIWD